MPQLNPGPWFMILVICWIIFLSIAPRVVLQHLFPNKPVLGDKLKPNMTPWAWRWH